jgi:hypothetical protein
VLLVSWVNSSTSDIMLSYSQDSGATWKVCFQQDLAGSVLLCGRPVNRGVGVISNVTSGASYPIIGAQF